MLVEKVYKKGYSMKLSKIASLCMVGMFIIGCGNNVPSCNDRVVKQVLGDAIKKHFKFKDVSFSGFTTNETNEAKKQVTCQVMAKATRKTGEIKEKTIHYTARYTDDGHIYVEIIN